MEAGIDSESKRELSRVTETCILIGVWVIWVYSAVTTFQTIHLRSVHFSVCKFYFNFEKKKKLSVEAKTATDSKMDNLL